MQFRFVVEAEAERTEGKFESRDTIEEAMLEWLDAANEGTIEGENGGQYEVSVWEISSEPTGKVTVVTPKTKQPPAPSVNVTAIIREWVKMNLDPENAGDGLEVALNELMDNFPSIARQEKAKLGS